MPSRPFDVALLLIARRRRCPLHFRQSSEDAKNELWTVYELATVCFGRHTSAGHMTVIHDTTFM